ncbi:SET domain-containing protein 9 [Lepeophtheirus salmonis]|uniref:SET domain-containing protein 9 n=1 Tax=Lepeophtheirus salmonis TaxID=72036 RepID=UPI001AE2A8A4|nr:SET domain-containing protein 9-like [Lepeophtheirus salmonis]XP_040581094.1 SET domain-containing protein 9-like [Lepeophtheirus salmonis]
MTWNNYKYRFLPWLIFNIKEQLAPLNKNIQKYETLSPSHLKNSVIDVLKKLNPHLDYKQNNDLLAKHFGFRLKVADSDQRHGVGVYVSSGSVSPGQVVALYPGTVYHPGDPVFLQSLFNPYILRCKDGIMIDGKSYGLSGSFFKSISHRDRYPDATWLRKNRATPCNPLNIGQLINNGGDKRANVTYTECNWDLNVNFRLNYLIPNVFYNHIHSNIIRIVPIVAVKEISVGEELLSTYFTLIE